MAKETSKPTRGQQRLKNGTVRVWAEVGATLPITNTYGNIRFSFGHERIAKNDSVEELKRVEALIDEFNEAVLDRRLNVYRRLFEEIMGSEDDRPKAPKTSRSAVQERARKKLKGGKK